MATLAESFLDDLNNASDEEDDDVLPEKGDNEAGNDGCEAVRDAAGRGEHGERDAPGAAAGDAEDAESRLAQVLDAPPRELEDARQLLGSPRLTKHLEDIASASAAGEPAAYRLVVEANSMCVEIDEEVERIHGAVSETYSERFPELVSHVPDPVAYLKAVQMIQNETDMSRLELSPTLTSAQAMAVSMTGSRLQTKPLAPELLSSVLSACRAALALVDIKTGKLLPFVASQMPRIAPNVCEILGAEVTAQLLAVVGGLDRLVKIPAGNVQVIGKGQRALHGFARSSATRHFGLIHACDLVQECGSEHRVKAMRVVAGRVALAARLDLAVSQRDGAAGRAWAVEIRGKLAKWHAPVPGKTKRALPVPETDSKKRRGGRRARRLKEIYGLTEVRKLANRVEFGVDDDEYGDAAMGQTFGMLGKDGSGRVRLRAKDRRVGSEFQGKAKRKAGQQPAGSAQQQQQHRRGLLAALGGGGGASTVPGAATSLGPATSGMASSIAFTPVHGIELVNPAAKQRTVDEANRRYFGGGELGFKRSRIESDAKAEPERATSSSSHGSGA